MIQPYSHQEALIQYPVPYKIGKETIIIYPLTYKATIDINRHLRAEFLNGLEDNSLKGQEAIDYCSNLMKVADTLTYDSGKGREIFLSSTKLLIYFVRHLCRFNEEWTEERLHKLLFPTGTINDVALIIITEMKTVVSRAVPPFPTLNIQKKEPKYKATQEEIEAKIFKTFAEKFGWTYKEIMELTDYQIYWYSYLHTDEREHIEEMDALAHKDHTPGTIPPPTSANVKQLTDPKEIQAWMQANMARLKKGNNG